MAPSPLVPCLYIYSPLPSPPLSHADHVDGQGPGLSHHVDHGDQLNHRRQRQLAKAVVRVCFFHWEFSHPLTPTLCDLFSHPTHPKWPMAAPWPDCCLRTGKAMVARGVALPSKCPPFMPKHSSLNRKGTHTRRLLCRAATVANDEQGT